MQCNLRCAIIVVLQILGHVASKEVNLYHWENIDFKSWIAHKTPASSGWYVPSNLNPLRWTVCDYYINSEPNSWLRNNPVFSVDEANTVYITVGYSISKCSSLPGQQKQHCKDWLTLHVNQTDNLIDQSLYPDPVVNPDAYEKIGNLTAGDNQRTFSLRKNGKYLLIALHDQGSCTNLYSVKVHYFVCPGETLNSSLITLPETVAPANDAASIGVKGDCTVENSIEMPGSLIVLCESNGEWNTSGIEGKCVCKQGTENLGGQCKLCSDNQFNDLESSPCIPCPANSLSTSGRTRCECKPTFYRAQWESIRENCTSLPSAPRHAVASFVNQTAVVLQWFPPGSNGGRNDVFYEVKCRKPCDETDGTDCVTKPCRDDVNYSPDKEHVNGTKIIVTNLFSFVNYTFIIYAKNGVSAVALTKDSVIQHSTSLYIRTNGSVPGEPKVSADWLAESSTVDLSWILELKNGIIEKYHVTYTRDDDSSDTDSTTTQESKMRLKELKSGKTYKFEVFAVNHVGWGPPGETTFKIPVGGITESLVIYAAAGGGSLLFIIVVITIVIVCCGRRRRNSNDYIRALERGSEMQSFDQSEYIDPGNYIDIMELLAGLTTEIDRDKVRLKEVIGQGEFADVYKGVLMAQEGKTLVAVKILRHGSSEKNQKDFLSEASIMGQFKHPNVILLIGVVTQSAPMMIITEFLESGSLEHFLKKRDGELAHLQLLGMARGVAFGMVYLSEKKFIHRDLAARNILVGENMACKVTDFGLSRELSGDNPESEYETQGGKIPLRWTAPEAIQHRLFSSASDVWSYGILLWEIMSFSDRPYWDWNNYDVINRVETGYRLPPPKNCPKIIHQLMLDCWRKDKNERPKFADIVSRLDDLIRSPEFLKDDVMREASTPPTTDMSEVQDVQGWLKKINMVLHSEKFHAAGIETLDQVMKLEDKDLKEMGISLIGHRNRMNKSIIALKSSFSNKGFVEQEENM